MSEKQAKRLRRSQRAQKEPPPGERSGDGLPASSDRWALPLQSLVPLKMLSLYERGGITWRDVFLAYLAGEVLGLEADSSHRAGGPDREDRRLLNRAARALAVLSYLPGGVPEGWGQFDAESYLARFIGAADARAHVDAAVRRALAIPASRAPLSELARCLFPQAGAAPGEPLPIAYLTLDGDPPEPTALAHALIAHLAIDHFLRAWRRSPQQAPHPQVEVLRGALLSAAGTRSEGVHGPDAGLVAALGDAEFWLAHYLRCYQRLEASRAQQPGRIGTLYAFARSGEPMHRAILQQLAVLIACDQFFVLQDELPEDQEYLDLVEILHILLP